MHIDLVTSSYHPNVEAKFIIWPLNWFQKSACKEKRGILYDLIHLKNIKRDFNSKTTFFLP